MKFLLKMEFMARLHLLALDSGLDGIQKEDDYMIKQKVILTQQFRYLLLLFQIQGLRQPTIRNYLTNEFKTLNGNIHLALIILGVLPEINMLDPL